MSETTPDVADVVVVGAGMAGTTAARVVRDAGLRVVIVDKGRAVGGRMATRRIGNARFDHGAQHFSVRTAPFRAVVDELAAAGVAREWFRSQSITRPERSVEVRHAGTDGMRGIVAHLASGLDVRTSVTVERLHAVGRRVEVGAGDLQITARAVVLTPPVPQLADLLAASGIEPPADLTRMIQAVEYDACLAVMAVLDGPSGLREGHSAGGGGSVVWIADNQHKGISSEPAVTIHGSPAFSAAHVDEEPHVWVPRLVAEAQPHLSSVVVSAAGHRWRFAQPKSVVDQGCAVIAGAVPIVLAGEVFSGARIEGAFSSGVAAGGAVVAQLA